MERSPSVDGAAGVELGAGPIRTCAGCRRRDQKAHLVRMVADGAGRLRIDPRAREPGRGVYVHAERRCIDEFLRTGAAARSLRRRIVNSAELTPALWLDCNRPEAGAEPGPPGPDERPFRDDVSRSVE